MLDFMLSRRWLNQVKLRLSGRKVRTRRPALNPQDFFPLEVRALLTVTILNNNGQGVQGLSFAQSGGYIPPDTDMASGEVSMIETVNQAVALYSNHDIGALSVSDSMSHFFFTVGKLPAPIQGPLCLTPVATSKTSMAKPGTSSVTRM
ncbi:MAG: hypothetical protein JSS02_20550 [Planctomycetes bacterium]|nr:hypothetical protein [Planctomycetota bacterium]